MPDWDVSEEKVNLLLCNFHEGLFKQSYLSGRRFSP